jgi:hypothetical protein
MKATPNERSLAQMVASMITIHRKLWQRSARAKGAESDWERFYEQQRNRESIIGFYICNFSGGNPARFLQLIAAALDGKLHGTKYEEAFLNACGKAIKRRLRNKTSPGLEINDLCLTSSEVTDVMALVCTEMGLKKFPNKTSHVRRHVLRLAAKLGYKLGYKCGRPRKKLPRLEVTQNRGNKKKRSLSQSLSR